MAGSLKRSLPVEGFRSAKRSLRIEDEDEPFNLEGLIPDLFGSIVEKMSFKDFKTFNFASSFSADMCGARKELEARVQKVYICEVAESFEVDEKKKELCFLKKNVRLHAKTVEIDKVCLKAIIKHKITADTIEFFNDTGLDPEFVGNVLELTNPKSVEFHNVTMKTLQLESLKKMDPVRVWPSLEFNDRDLLSLKLERFLLGYHENISITTNGVLEMLQEWKRGEREIRTISIFTGQPINARTIVDAFPGHRQKPSLRMTLCRQDGHMDLILDVTASRIVSLKAVPCPGHGTWIPQGPTRHVQVAFRGRRRNHPL